MFFYKLCTKTTRGKGLLFPVLTVSLVLMFCLLGAFPAKPAMAGFWQISVADQGKVGSFTSLALDSHNNPCISYYDYGNAHLKYFFYDTSGVPRTETVDNVIRTGSMGSSLALDGNGNPHICYYTDYNGFYGHLFYIHKDASGWHRVNFPDDYVHPNSMSLALDGSSMPHVTYCKFSGIGSLGPLVYAHRDNSGWHTETIDDVSTCFSTSLALDSSGQPHIAYYREGYPKFLKHAYKDSDGWHIETVADSSCGGSVSLRLDSSGAPRISYTGAYGDQRYLKYAYRNASGWQTENVDTAGVFFDCGTSLTLDASGNPCISYCDFYKEFNNSGFAGRLKYAHRDASGWHTQIVDGYGDSSSGPLSNEGLWSSLALNSYGDPVISYWDYYNDYLLIACWQPSPAAPLNLTATTAPDFTINLSWTPDPHTYNSTAGYKIERKLNDGNYTEIATVPRTVIAYSDTGLSSNNTYCYRVRAYNSLESSDYSNETCTSFPKQIKPNINIQPVIVHLLPAAPSDLLLPPFQTRQFSCPGRTTPIMKQGTRLEEKQVSGKVDIT